jgi:hypothetical protein
MNKLACLVILLASTCACRSVPPLATRAAAVSAPATQVPDDFVLTLQRSECYGECPVYSVTVDAAGNVEYEGTQFVTVKGPARWRVSPKIVAHLLRLFERVRFFETEFRCHELWSDVPTQTITLNVGGREKIVANRWGGGSEFYWVDEPDQKLDPDLDLHALLDWIAYWIDIALDTAPYVKGAKPRGVE